MSRRNETAIAAGILFLAAVLAWIVVQRPEEALTPPPRANAEPPPSQPEARAPSPQEIATALAIELVELPAPPGPPAAPAVAMPPPVQVESPPPAPPVVETPPPAPPAPQPVREVVPLRPAAPVPEPAPEPLAVRAVLTPHEEAPDAVVVPLRPTPPAPKPAPVVQPRATPPAPPQPQPPVTPLKPAPVRPPDKPVERKLPDPPVVVRAEPPKPAPPKAAPPSEPPVNLLATVSEGRAYLKILEQGSGPGIEIRWPSEPSQRDRLYTVLVQCLGMRTGLLDGEGRLFLGDGQKGQPSALDGERYSGFVRRPEGAITRDEEREIGRVRGFHQVRASASAARIFPRRVDAYLIGGLRQLVGDGYLKTKAVRATYRLRNGRPVVDSIVADGRRIEGSIDLAAVADRCAL